MNRMAADGASARGAARWKALKRQLDLLYARFGGEHISPDPLEVVREQAASGLEVAAFVASALAYGNARQIVRSTREALALIGPPLRESVLSLTPGGAAKRFAGFRHRFNTGADLARMALALGKMLRRHGTLENAFLVGYQPDAPHAGGALERFAAEMAATRFPALDRLDRQLGRPSRADYFWPLPSRGSACKRLNLFLKWVARPADGVDLGLWTRVRPAHLLMPVDTHVWRIARWLGLTKRATADWKAVLEITASLRRLDPDDPVKYDFALSRLGIRGLCRAGDSGRHCAGCELQGVCLGEKRAPNARE